MRQKKKQAFTLIELLTVIAIIGILAGILIPTVGSVRRQANIAASKAQLSNYVNAIQMFKGEYKFLPFATNQDFSLEGNVTEFKETLSGRTSSGGALPANHANRRGIAFHSFSESEFFVDDDGTTDPNRIVDRFNNENITIVVDHDGDGLLSALPTSGTGTVNIRATVTAYVLNDTSSGEETPDYFLYDQ